MINFSLLCYLVPRGKSDLKDTKDFRLKLKNINTLIINKYERTKLKE